MARKNAGNEGSREKNADFLKQNKLSRQCFWAKKCVGSTCEENPDFPVHFFLRRTQNFDARDFRTENYAAYAPKTGKQKPETHTTHNNRLVSITSGLETSLKPPQKGLKPPSISTSFWALLLTLQLFLARMATTTTFVCRRLLLLGNEKKKRRGCSEHNWRVLLPSPASAPRRLSDKGRTVPPALRAADARLWRHRRAPLSRLLRTNIAAREEKKQERGIL